MCFPAETRTLLLGLDEIGQLLDEVGQLLYEVSQLLYEVGQLLYEAVGHFTL